MQAALISFDHLALAFLGCYGNTWLRTPAFDQLAAESVVFDQCYGGTSPASAFAELPALADSITASGGFSCIHRCASGPAADSGLGRAIADWQRAAAGGRPALLWLRHPGIASPWSERPDRIVAAWRESFPNDSLHEALTECGAAPADPGASPEQALAAALPPLLTQGLLSRECSASSSAVGRLRRSIYAAAVAALDQWLTDVMAVLNAAAPPNTLCVVTAGTGDLTGPHAGLSAGCPPLIEPLVRVPLLIRTGTTADGTRRGGLVRTTDLAPTLADWFQMQRPDDRGNAAHSIWPLLNGETETIREELLIGAAATGWNLRSTGYSCVCDPIVAVRTEDGSPDFETDHVRLYVKPDDPWDTLDVARQFPDATADAVRRIRASVQVGAAP